MKIYITKRALTRGIEVQDTEIETDWFYKIREVKQGKHKGQPIFRYDFGTLFPTEYFYEEEDAIKKAEDMRIKKNYTLKINLKDWKI